MSIISPSIKQTHDNYECKFQYRLAKMDIFFEQLQTVKEMSKESEILKENKRNTEQQLEQALRLFDDFKGQSKIDMDNLNLDAEQKIFALKN